MFVECHSKLLRAESVVRVQFPHARESLAGLNPIERYNRILLSKTVIKTNKIVL